MKFLIVIAAFFTVALAKNCTEYFESLTPVDMNMEDVVNSPKRYHAFISESPIPCLDLYMTSEPGGIESVGQFKNDTGDVVETYNLHKEPDNSYLILDFGQPDEPGSDVKVYYIVTKFDKVQGIKCGFVCGPGDQNDLGYYARCNAHNDDDASYKLMEAEIKKYEDNFDMMKGRKINYEAHKNCHK